MPLMSNVRAHVNKRPIHIWLLVISLAAITVWLLYAISTAAAYYVQGGHSLRLMAAYAPAFIGACVCATACFGIFFRKAWVRWLFLLPVVGAVIQLLSLVPYLLLSLKPITDPAAKASIRYVLGGAIQPLVFTAVSIVLAVVVFRYFRQELANERNTSRANREP